VVEIDTRSPSGLRYIRERSEIPVASGECLFGRRDYRPFSSATRWTWRSSTSVERDRGVVKIAAMADAYEVNVAPTTSTATWRP
jgi:L-alanine-DL-glutamate epimerase-like enolase superfamily enzyme